MNIKEILLNLNYQINSESATHYSCTALYRGGDNKKALSIEKKTGRWFDFVTGHGSGIEKLISKTLNFDESQVEEWLKNKNFEASAEEPKERIKMAKIIDPKDLFLLPNNFFFNERGISDETLSFFRSGLASGGSMYQRYTFPIFNRDGQIEGLVGRIVVNKEGSAKWKIVGAKKNFVYPYYFNKLDIKEANEIVLVESIGDMLSLWQCGFKNTLVLFGIKISPAIITKLIEINPARIIIATNNDLENGAGNHAAAEIESKLLKFFDSERVIIGLPQGENDFGIMFQKFGAKSIIDWHKGLFID